MPHCRPLISVTNSAVWLYFFALFFSALFFGSLWSHTVHADRIIKFRAAADNRMEYGRLQASPTKSTCILTVNNQSGVDQRYTITLDASTAATGLGAGAVTTTTSPGSY